MSAGTDFDELSEAVPNLRLGERSQKAKIKECVSGRVVGTQSVLVVAIVDSYLNGNLWEISIGETRTITVTMVGNTEASIRPMTVVGTLM